MQLTVSPNLRRVLRRVTPRMAYSLVELGLLALLAWQLARLIWTALVPLGPVGDWRAAPATLSADYSLLTRFDPFNRFGAASPSTVVTSLPLKLFGLRQDLATGRGSAIIGDPNGLQTSFAVGDEVMPGAILKAVNADHVDIERGGTVEKLFIDQGTPATVAGAPGAVSQVPTGNPRLGPPPPPAIVTPPPVPAQ